MGRPQKVTLDFFLHDAGASADIKIRSIRRVHGNDGYATYFTLLELCCKEKGMKLRLESDINAQVIALECALRDVPHLYKVIQSCADMGLFNKQLWESERIVFSDSLHSRYVERLEIRKSDAQRKRQGRLARKLQEQIDSLENKLSAVTTALSQESPKGRPSPEEETEGELERELEEETSSSEEVQEAAPVVVKADRFFGQPKVVRRIEMVRTTPRWDQAAPWRDDGERKQFDDWLRAKYKTKNDPARYAAAIVGKVAKGEPIVDWEEFTARSSGNSKAEVLAEWGNRRDWENFPLLTEWSQQHDEIGANAFASLGGRNSPQHRFSDWLIAQEVAC